MFVNKIKAICKKNIRIASLIKDCLKDYPINVKGVTHGPRPMFSSKR